MFENLVGLNVINEKLYSEYRKNMTPILEGIGGGFRYDFRVSETLINEKGKTINRLFVIYFPDKDSAEIFFTNPDYIKIKKEFFEPAVESTTIISSYIK